MIRPNGGKTSHLELFVWYLEALGTACLMLHSRYLLRTIYMEEGLAQLMSSGEVTTRGPVLTIESTHP